MAKYNINNYLFTKACCLGDGSLTLKTNRKKTAQFSCTHSIKQEEYIKYTLGRQILVFAILWMGTKDIVVALVLTCVFIVFADYLFNDTSKFCIIPNKCIVPNNKEITKKEINDALNILKKARQKKNKYKSNEMDIIINKGLYKENFM